MCEKCVELDKKIEHYGQLSRWITDQKRLNSSGCLLRKCAPKKQPFIQKPNKAILSESALYRGVPCQTWINCAIGRRGYSL
jgi:hypothetical protein